MQMKKLLAAVAASALMVGVPAMTAHAAPLTPQQASTACAAYFHVAEGPEPLSACQWDMRLIHAGAESYAHATGEGVRVGVIDGGVDLTHPDLTANLDVASSCSFIYTTTPTAD